jgi:hypothetical protein
MADAAQLKSILQQLLEVHDSAFNLGEHAIAFHALSAAAHAAEVLEDLDSLDRVAALSRRELEWIDRNDPANRLSSVSAGKRSHQSIFEQLAVTALTMHKRIAAEHTRRNAAARLEELRD